MERTEVKKLPIYDENSDSKISSDPQSFSSLLGVFATSTSAHGIAKIYAAKRNSRRMLWVLSVLLVYSLLFWMCAQLLVQFMNKPVQTRIEVTQEERLEFPSVTICNLNMLRQNMLTKNRELYNKLETYGNYSDEARMLTYGKSNNTLKTTKKNWRGMKNHRQAHKAFKNQKIRRAKSKKQRNLFAGAEIDKSNVATKLADKLLRNTSVKYLKTMGHQFHGFVVDCRWSHFKCNTGSFRKLWKQFWHWKYGNCYTFNSGIAADGKKVPVLTVDRPGPYQGLELLLDIQQNYYLPTTEEAGVRVVLTDKRKMPFPFDEGFSVPTGFSTSVGVRRVQTRRVDPFHNNSCASGTNSHRSEDYYRKLFNSDYSVLTCRNSCLASNQLKNCNCSETRFPFYGSLSCQTEEQEKCLDEVIERYEKLGLECAQKCPQPCLDNVYRYTISSSKWSRKYLSKMIKEFHWRFKDDRVALGENFLKLSIFYKELSQEKVIYKEAYLLENLLADIGGQLGLWIGVSILTAGELIELIVNLITFVWSKGNWKRRKEDKTKENSLVMS